ARLPACSSGTRKRLPQVQGNEMGMGGSSPRGGGICFRVTAPDGAAKEKRRAKGPAPFARRLWAACPFRRRAELGGERGDIQRKIRSPWAGPWGRAYPWGRA